MDLVNLMNSVSLNENEDINESNLRIFGVLLDNIYTDIVYGEFSDNYMIVATQYGKVASLLKVTIDQPETNLDLTAPVYSVNILFGTDSIENIAAVRYIAEQLDIKKPLLIFLSLKSYDSTSVNLLLKSLKGLTLPLNKTTQ